MEPDLCLFARIDFCGAIRVDLGLGFQHKKKKKKTERERERETKNVYRGKMKNRWSFKKKFKILFSMQRRRGICRGVPERLEIFFCVSTQWRRDLRCSVECHTAAYQEGC